MCSCFLLICILFLFISLSAFDEVESFYYEIEHGTNNTVDIYLWFNFTIYKYTLYSPQKGDNITVTTFSNPPLEVYGSSNCNKTIRNSAVDEAKMMIINEHRNKVMIGKVMFTTVSHQWYGIDTFYISSGAKQNYICVSNASDECAPSKQITYFSLSQENQYLDGALWEDATTVYPQLMICDPTQESTVVTEAATNSSTVVTDSAAVEEQSIYDILGIKRDSIQYYIIIGGANVVICICFAIVLLSICNKRKRKKNTWTPNMVSMPSSSYGGKQGTRLIKLWLQRKVELPEYLDNFVDNGYENINWIRKIKHREELQVIGIHKVGHQTLLLSEIETLQRIVRSKNKKIRHPADVAEQKPKNHTVKLSIQDSVNKVILSFFKKQIQKDENNAEESDADNDIMENIAAFIEGKGETFVDNDELKEDGDGKNDDKIKAFEGQ